MSDLIVVAIPDEQDRVWDVSSEKVPHLTILYLGDSVSTEDTNRIVEFVEHASSSMLSRFGLTVDRRGTLGEDDADVLFFSGVGIGKLVDFRTSLLRQSEILNAYNSAKQFPKWTPHLTLGYPTSPAKPDPNDYPIGYVGFNRIAVWTGDSVGPTFDLKDEMAMSDTLEDVLTHYGIKGMKWGVRRANKSSHPRSEDAVKVANYKKVAKKHGPSALSNQELQALVTRMNLDQQYGRLMGAEPKRFSKGQKYLKGALTAGKTVNEVIAFANSPAGKALRTQLNKK